MPTLTRWFVRTALISLLLGTILGAASQFPGLHIPSAYPIFVHLFTVGWLTQLVFGIAIWMFPTLSKEHPRGIEWLGWTIYITLNLGLLMRIVFEPIQVVAPSDLSSTMLALSALLQWSAVMVFVGTIWPRARSSRAK